MTDIRSVGFRPASAQKWYSEVCLGRRRDKALQTRGLTFFLRVGFDGTRRELDMGGCLHVTGRWNSWVQACRASGANFCNKERYLLGKVGK